MIRVKAYQLWVLGILMVMVLGFTTLGLELGVQDLLNSEFRVFVGLCAFGWLHFGLGFT